MRLTTPHSTPSRSPHALRLRFETHQSGTQVDRPRWLADVLREYEDRGATVCGALWLVTGVKQPVVGEPLAYAELRAELSGNVVIPPEFGEPVAVSGSSMLSPEELSSFDTVDRLHREYGAHIAIRVHSRVTGNPPPVERLLADAVADVGLSILVGASDRRDGQITTVYVASPFRVVEGQFDKLYERVSTAVPRDVGGGQLTAGWIERLWINPEDYKRVTPLV
ncbi:MAG: hypothetical protein KF912_14395 [Phycisphaeraceae bacterium]|nr:hypothetical protein [Phycisphaeraceae bacterium]MBX3368494.1 hypothetical protein [Phycisphaeraceae bacterium]